jgi:hypothetical protein
LNPVREEERAGGGVVELATIVALESTNQAAELGGDPSKKVRKSGKYPTSIAMEKVIHNHQVIFII